MVTEMLDTANLLRLEVNAPPRVSDFQRRRSDETGHEEANPRHDHGRTDRFRPGRLWRDRDRVSRPPGHDPGRRAEATFSARSPAFCRRANGKVHAGAAEAIGEAMEKARTQLLQQFARPGGKVIAVTSALTEEGKGLPRLATCRKLQPSRQPNAARRFRSAFAVACIAS